MNVSGQINSHVYIDDLDAWKLEGNQTWDRLLGTVLILCTLLGVVGNLLAIRYFYRSRRMGNLANQLYISICCIDVCTSIAHIPAMISLYSDRYPVLFNNMILCACYNFVFAFLQKISMFLVLLMSVFRCFRIISPHYKIHERKYITVFPVYCLLVISFDTIILFQDGITLYYGPGSADCFKTAYVENMETVHSAKIWYSIYMVLDAVEIGIPPVLCFICFVSCTIKLSSSTPTEASAQRNRKAAITVTMFTGLFLVCNLPYFVVKILDLITVSFYSYPGPLFSPKFMYWYAWPLARIVFTALNAALNPVLYYFRVAKFRIWITNFFRSSVQSVDFLISFFSEAEASH